MEQEIFPHVSPSLHPKVITAIDHYEQHKGYCGHAADALKFAYQAINDVVVARKTVRLDETRTAKAQHLAVSGLADKYLSQMHTKVAGSWDRLDKGITSIEKSLSKPLEEQAGIGVVNSEIRSHAKSLSFEERRKMINKAIRENDAKTCAAILGAPAYISGLREDEHTVYTRQYHEATNQQTMQRLQVMTTAKQRLEQSEKIILAEMKKAVGMSGLELQHLRDNNAAAEAALQPKDFSDS